MAAVAELDRIFSSSYEDICRARELFKLDNSLPEGLSLPEVDGICFEAYESGLLVIAGSAEVGVRGIMNSIKDKSLSRRDYRAYADTLIQVLVNQIDPVYESGVPTGIAISFRGGFPFEKPLFERLHDADTGFTQQTRNEITMNVASIPSKMRSFKGRHTVAADLMVATGGSMVDLLLQAEAEGANKCTVLAGFSTPQPIARLLALEHPLIERIISLPLEAGLINLSATAKNFIFGGVGREFQDKTPEELQELVNTFMLGDHGDRYYKDAGVAH